MIAVIALQRWEPQPRWANMPLVNVTYYYELEDPCESSPIGDQLPAANKPLVSVAHDTQKIEKRANNDMRSGSGDPYLSITGLLRRLVKLPVLHNRYQIIFILKDSNVAQRVAIDQQYIR